MGIPKIRLNRGVASFNDEISGGIDCGLSFLGRSRIHAMGVPFCWWSTIACSFFNAP